MKPDEPDPLLNEILAGEDLSEFRRESLARTLEALQRRNRRRRAGRIGLATVPLLAALALVLARLPKPAAVPATGNPSPLTASAPPAPAAPVKVITDEELFALFPDRAMALIGPPGHQRLVFLDQPAKKKPSRRL